MTEQEIREWVERQREANILMSDEVDHVAMCLHHIWQWYHENLPVGGFVSAVLRNDFCAACGRADDTNKRALPLYAMFVYNYLPADYREKAKAEL